MDAFIRHKQIGGLNTYRKPIVAATTIALIIVIFVGNLQQLYAAIPNEPAKISASASTETQELSQRIKQLVKELEYSDKVAEDFVEMVMGWKDPQGEPVLVAWKQKLNEARQDYKQGKSSKDQLAKVEEIIARELSQKIRKEVRLDFSEKFFDLADVIKNKQAQCLSYSQLVYILGNFIGLSVKAINVVELMTGKLSIMSHVACIVGLTDNKLTMVDLAELKQAMISKPFELEREFKKIGDYWELKDRDNPLGVHRRIQILDTNGVIANVCNNRGFAYTNLGQFNQAISEYNKAIELNPKLAEAYNNRGIAYDKLGQHTRAMSDYNKAIELNPKDAMAYNNRGTAYTQLGEYTKALSDFTKAIEFNPKLAEAYNNRGFAYTNLGQFNQAISDYNKAIELNPKLAEAYNNRGGAYINLGQFNQAISDSNKAIELNPKDAMAYYIRGLAYCGLGKSEEAKKNLLKAVELNPALKAIVKRISEQFKLNIRLD